MKRSSLITILVLLALTIGAVYVYKSKGKSTTINTEASQFKYADTASIDKMFLADKEGKTILLEKKAGVWMVNGKFPARPDAIDVLLYTIKAVEIKYPVSKSARESVIKIMAAKSTKIEIYSHGEKVRQYYVGHTTQDHTGTFMILTDLETGDNFEEPFITHIPGFEGYLTARYFTDENEWKTRYVLNYRPPQIKQIKMELHEMPDSSYVVDLFSMQRFGMKTLKGQPIPFEESAIKQFIAYFQNLNCELPLSRTEHLTDSLRKSGIPFVTLTVTDRNDVSSKFQFYHMQPSKAKNEQYGKDYKYDPDRFFVQYNNGEDYAIAQFYVFGKILQTYGYFLTKH